ncbi:carbonic anhydrase [Pseudaestuariivita rosea]|uniref:carbonic anhydrase n=1 Tax=Pseudaestuariivita rosea TaxID=2763263 RepID=UPI001ABA383F|nr:carbonic anhydrase [Pseudaestuariivita rosea]
MKQAKPLPAYLVQRYQAWKDTTYDNNQAWFRRLADQGQHPRAMVISCCDSRVHVTSIFGADPGEFFIHRNVANLVPPYDPECEAYSTSAAVEYAVRVLKVAHLIVLGHSNCGGVRACHDMCVGNAPELEDTNSFIGRRMNVLRPGYELIKHVANPEERIEALEKQSVIISLQNLYDFPFVAEAVDRGQLSLHGLWTDIAEGELYMNDGHGGFVPL